MVRVSCGSEGEMRTGHGRCLFTSREARTDATFAAGVVEVSVPLPAKAEPKVRKVDIHDATAHQDRGVRRPL
jgi:hypothetical protein